MRQLSSSTSKFSSNKQLDVDGNNQAQLSKPMQLGSLQGQTTTNSENNSSQNQKEVMAIIEDKSTQKQSSTRIHMPYTHKITEKNREVWVPKFEIDEKTHNFAEVSNVLNNIGDINKVDSMNKLNSVKVEFNVGVDKSVVSEKSLNILKQVSHASGNDNICITSTLRSPSKQAEVMYNDNLTKGFADQYNLYGSKGDQVIRIHENNKDRQKEEIIELMTRKINQLTPSEVSKHCGNHNDINVFDISIANLKNPDLFYNELLKLEGSLISRIIDERKRGCIHVEIKQ